MQKIAGDGATGDGHFQAGNPTLGQVATEFTADWGNAVQDELVNVVEAAGLTLNPADNFQLLQAIRQLQSAGGRRNVIINGAFELNARGGAHVFTTGTPRYTLDRWRLDPGSGNTQTITVSRAGGDTPSFTVKTRSSYQINIARGGATNGATNPRLTQPVEGVLTFAGTKCTLSLWAFQSGGTTDVTLTPKLVQFKGTGQGVEATLAGATITPSTVGFVRYTWTFDVPDIAQQTLANDNYLELQLEFSSAGDRTVVLRAVQLEVGNTASVFEDLPLSDVELLCARYYEKSFARGTAPGTAGLQGASMDRATGSNSYGLQQRFRVEKRATPTVRWYAPNTGTADAITYGGADLAASPLAVSTSATGYPTHADQGSTAANSWGHWTADAEFAP